MTDCLRPLEDRLGYRFVDQALLRAALTHRSASGASNNERLEFLGDALLSLVIADTLHATQTEAPEGDLSRLRASLVRRSTLAEIAKELALGECLEMGAGETRSGGQQRSSTLADALEAVFGAIYRDAGFAAGSDTILRLYRSRLDALPSAESLKDAKTQLQEWLQSRNLPLPVYTITDVKGKAHDCTFSVSCRIEGLDLESRGTGHSRKRAEQQSAARALEHVRER